MQNEKSTALRLRIRDLARSRVAPWIDEGETSRAIPGEVRAAMAEEGCFGRALPAAYGGTDDGLRGFAVQQEELSRVWPTAAVAATWTNLSGLLLSKFGSDDQKAQLLTRAASGQSLGAVAWTEPHGGSDAAAITTTATRVDGGWRLSGTKRLIDNVTHADYIIVSARTAADGNPRKGISMFVVQRDDPGFCFGGTYDTLGLRAAGVGWFELRDCFLPDERLLGDEGRGFYQMMAMVEFGRIGVAAICLGITTAVLDETVGFLRERTSFGRSLSTNDVVLATLADLRVRLDGAALLTERAIEMYDAGIRCSTESAIAKLAASELSNDATETALHLHGGIGFTSEGNVLRFFQDSRAFTIGEGTSEILRMIVGREEFVRDRQ